MAGTLNRQTVVLPVLPAAVDPLALSLNENPFPPLPAVQSALIESIGVANRYPEFLPERLRGLIAAHIGVGENQVVLGAGATGVAMQVLHAATDPGDRMVMTTPTFDGYPIFAQMARLVSVTVPMDPHGHHDLDALADAASSAGWWCCATPQPKWDAGIRRRCRDVPATGTARHHRAPR